MKTTEYDKKDGTKGTKNKLEAGDVFTSRFANVRENNAGMYPNFSLGVTTSDNNEIYVQLTANQAEQLRKLGDLTGKKLEAYGYSNKYGDQVGVGFPKGD